MVFAPVWYFSEFLDIFLRLSFRVSFRASLGFHLRFHLGVHLGFHLRVSDQDLLSGFPSVHVGFFGAS